MRTRRRATIEDLRQAIDSLPRRTRTSLIAFAQAWDRVAFRGQRAARARRATERELLILRSHLEASLLEDAPLPVELAAARAEHEALMARRHAGADHPGEPDRTLEPSTLSARPARRGRARRRRDGRSGADVDRQSARGTPRRRNTC